MRPLASAGAAVLPSRPSLHLHSLPSCHHGVGHFAFAYRSTPIRHHLFAGHALQPWPCVVAPASPLARLLLRQPFEACLICMHPVPCHTHRTHLGRAGAEQTTVCRPGSNTDGAGMVNRQWVGRRRCSPSRDLMWLAAVDPIRPQSYLKHPGRIPGRCMHDTRAAYWRWRLSNYFLPRPTTAQRAARERALPAAALQPQRAHGCWRTMVPRASQPVSPRLVHALAGAVAQKTGCHTIDHAARCAARG